MNGLSPIHDENDPRLTALVLGELPDAKRDALLALSGDEREADRFANLEAELRDLAATAERIREVLAEADTDSPGLGDEVRAQILYATAAPAPRSGVWGRVKRTWVARLRRARPTRPVVRPAFVVAGVLAVWLAIGVGLHEVHAPQLPPTTRQVHEYLAQQARSARRNSNGDIKYDRRARLEPDDPADRVARDRGRHDSAESLSASSPSDLWGGMMANRSHRYGGYVSGEASAAGVAPRAKAIVDDHPRPWVSGKQTITVYSSIAAHREPLYERPKGKPFVAAADQSTSTFGADVDSASYALVRSYLHRGVMPPPWLVRLEEMVNYFRFGDAWFDGEPLRTVTELTTSPWLAHRQILSVRVQARSLAPQSRPPSNLVFLIDVSGSMGAKDRLPLVKSALHVLVEQLQAQDRVSIVTYAGEAGVRLQPTPGDRKDEILTVIDGLTSDGMTHGSAGIEQAYALARAHFLAEGNNRVLLATDGDLNVGVTDPEDLAQLVEREAKSGVFLTTLGFGADSRRDADARLEKLADRGNGVYAHIDSLTEAQRVLGAQLQGALFTVAKDLKIQVEFNPRLAASYRLLGYDNRRLANADFANDNKDAGDVGAGHTVTALYEIEPVGAELLPAAATATTALRGDELARVRLRYKAAQGQTSELVERSVPPQASAFANASPDLRFAYGVAAFATLLAQNLPAVGVSWDKVRPVLAAAVGNDPERQALLTMLDEAQQIAAAPWVR